MLTRLKAITLFCALFCANECIADLTVSLPKGDIVGREFKGVADGADFYGFLEIPFAAPPVGKLRFQAPVEPDAWEGVLNTTENTKYCFQWNQKHEPQNEDCLYLNVYTPVNPGTRGNKSVLVFFFGGAFLWGNDWFTGLGPHYYIYHDVIVVTANYRVGPFGFLSTGDSVIPGNAGLKDQWMALKWVNENIHLFGGDPDKVTINGVSSGSASSAFHVVSKKAAGLFRGAIMESGSCISSWAIQRYSNQTAYNLAQAIDGNFTTNNSSEELRDFLQAARADDINMVPLQGLKGIQLGQGDIFAPVIEIGHDGAYITEKMHESLRNGDFNRVPVIIGFNSEERIFEAASLSSFKTLMAGYDADLKLIVNDDFNVPDDKKELVGKKIREIYTDGLFQDNLGDAIRFKSDARYTTSFSRHALLQSNYTDVYIYQFSYHGLLGGNNVTVPGAERVGHGEESIYLWRWQGLNISTYPEKDIYTHVRLITLWTNFVKYQNPTPEKDELFQNIIWPLAKPDKLQYLNINETLEVRVDPKEYKAWAAIIDEYGNPPFDTY